MKDWLLHHLACPFCEGALRVDLVVESREERLEYGVLACGRCGQPFAVVEGIPLLIPALNRLDVRCETNDDVVVRGARLSEVIEAIRRGDTVEALCLLLNPTTLDGVSWTFDPERKAPRRVFDGAVTLEPQTDAPPDSLPAALRRSLRQPYHGIRRAYREHMLPRWRRSLAAHLRANRERLSARRLFELYYGDYSGSEGMADYFVYRFGQPRHLAALSACSLLRGRPGVTLDLACGAGHLAHFLTYGLPDARVIGIDREYIRLFIAKHYMAPAAEFICMSADTTLPFRARTLSSVLCSDAFHYLHDKSVAARELERVLGDDAATVLTRVANAHLVPHEGYELGPEEYRALFPNLMTSVLGETALVEGYLARRLPALARPPSAQDLNGEKWLTIFASRSSSFFRDHGTFEAYPHAVGRLGVNPIYVEAPASDGSRSLSFEFPSRWYAFEDGAYRDYAVRKTVIPREVVEMVDEGVRSPAQESLIASFALIGMPDLYDDQLPQTMGKSS